MAEEKARNIADEEILGNTPEAGKKQEANAGDMPEREANDTAQPSLEERLAQAEARVAELEKERLYRQAEFDNYRKNVMKEKADLILNGGKKVLESMLPVVDDMELAIQHIETAQDVAAVKEGVELIRKKFMQTLKSHGVVQMEAVGKDFDTDYHEAIAQIPAPSDEMKGKVVDCTKKGYTMNEKVLRFAQVVVGV
ncbi:MAG: nucleotide exchange factor GrpE [Prevotellaceae bacterium]|nr:nucleotide exchange factor GrpE [Prevotellaceae bacterium]